MSRFVEKVSTQCNVDAHKSQAVSAAGSTTGQLSHLSELTLFDSILQLMIVHRAIRLRQDEIDEEHRARRYESCGK